MHVRARVRQKHTGRGWGRAAEDIAARYRERGWGEEFELLFHVQCFFAFKRGGTQVDSDGTTYEVLDFDVVMPEPEPPISGRR
jgi:hypothetical protein